MASPAASSYNALRTMQANRRTSQLETAFRRRLWALGLRYRLDQGLPGHPDITFPRARLAVFVHGCFWHLHECGLPMPRANAEFWREKLVANRRRDAQVVKELRRAGWAAIVVWECDLRKDPGAAASRVAATAKARRSATK
jgi:DNA mismatch endonuclease (patch repair protein)